jgi:hypothetical protein
MLPRLLIFLYFYLSLFIASSFLFYFSLLLSVNCTNFLFDFLNSSQFYKMVSLISFLQPSFPYRISFPNTPPPPPPHTHTYTLRHISNCRHFPVVMLTGDRRMLWVISGRMKHYHDNGWKGGVGKSVFTCFRVFTRIYVKLQNMKSHLFYHVYAVLNDLRLKQSTVVLKCNSVLKNSFVLKLGRVM